MIQPTSSGSGSGIKQPKKERRGGGLFNLILIVAIIAVIAAFVWAEQQRRSAKAQLEETVNQLEELRQASQKSGQEVAKEVLSKLRAHINIPETPEPTVATIVNIDQLREANAFYKVAENGDHLVITENRAILYDPDNDRILDVVPVQINRNENQDSSTGSQASPRVSPRVTASVSPSPTATSSPNPSGN